MWQQGKEGQFIEEESTVQRGDAPGWGEGVVPQKGGYQGFTVQRGETAEELTVLVLQTVLLDFSSPPHSGDRRYSGLGWKEEAGPC